MTDGNCDEALHELYRFLDGELTDDGASAIQRHLDDCPPCSRPSTSRPSCAS